MFGITVITAVLTAAALANEIPREVLNQLQNLRTREDLNNAFVLKHEVLRPLFNNSLVSSTTHRKSKTVKTITSSGSLSLSSLKSGPSSENDIELIHEPIQSSDTCLPMNVCVSVPIDKQPKTFIFPQCIELSQCVGTCCDGEHKCHARDTQPVKVMVEMWEYGGYEDGRAKFTSKGRQYVRLDRHLSCSCKQCRATACALNHEFKDCRCTCKNGADAQNCTSPWVWSESNCACRCGLTRCAVGHILDRSTCRCERSPSGLNQIPVVRPTLPSMMVTRRRARNGAVGIIV